MAIVLSCWSRSEVLASCHPVVVVVTHSGFELLQTAEPTPTLWHGTWRGEWHKRYGCGLGSFSR